MPVYGKRVGAKLDNAQQAKRDTCRLESLDAGENAVVGAMTIVVDTQHVINRSGPVKAYSDIDLVVPKNGPPSGIEHRGISLYSYPHAYSTQELAGAATHRREKFRP